MRRERIKLLKKQPEGCRDGGTLYPPLNSSLHSPKKPNRSWRMSIDYGKAIKLFPIEAVVPDVFSLLEDHCSFGMHSFTGKMHYYPSEWRKEIIHSLQWAYWTTKCVWSLAPVLCWLGTGFPRVSSKGNSHLGTLWNITLPHYINVFMLIRLGHQKVTIQLWPR